MWKQETLVKVKKATQLDYNDVTKEKKKKTLLMKVNDVIINK